MQGLSSELQGGGGRRGCGFAVCPASQDSDGLLEFKDSAWGSGMRSSGSGL